VAVVGIVFQRGRPARARPEHDLARPYAARPYQARRRNSAVPCRASCRSGGPSTTRWPFFRAVPCLSTMAPAVGLVSSLRCRAVNPARGVWEGNLRRRAAASSAIGRATSASKLRRDQPWERNLRRWAAANPSRGGQPPPPGRRESVAGRATSAAGPPRIHRGEDEWKPFTVGPRRASLERGSRGGGGGAGGRGTRAAERGGGGRVAVLLRVAGGEIAGPGGGAGAR
jgi:hypothetical protein